MRRLVLALVLCLFAWPVQAQISADFSAATGGSVRPGWDGGTCNSGRTGAIRYNSSITGLQFCDGTAWEPVGVVTGSCAAPSGLSFSNVTGATLNTVYTSAAVTITFTGCTGPYSVSVSGAGTAQISVNGGQWSTSGAIYSGQTLQVRLTSSGSISTGLTATVTVGPSSTTWTVTTRSAALQVFSTYFEYTASGLGGLSGADSICQSEAGWAGLAGTYKAIMSSDATSAASRLTLSYPIVNACDGSTVAPSNLWAGSITDYIFNPYGCGVTTATVITGTNSNGSRATGATCNSWSSSGSYVSAWIYNYSNSGWINNGTNDCDSWQGVLYCIQQ